MVIAAFDQPAAIEVIRTWRTRESANDCLNKVYPNNIVE